MKKSLKGITIAAVIAIGSFGPAKAAAPEFTDLQLSYGGPFSYTFHSTVNSASSFWSIMEGLSATKTYSQISGYFASFFQDGEDIEGKSTIAKLGGRNSPSWVGEISFNSGTISFEAADVNGIVTPFSGSTVPVPGPEAGAGIGALAMAGMAYVAMRRRKQQIAA